ncbi:MAG: Pelagibacter phage [Pseudomonadota bacterium]|jgi:hypothetical protein
MNSFAGSIPKHQYIWIDSNFTHKKPTGFVPAVWFGLTSFPSRAWGFNVMFENGAIYRNIPPHAISFSENPEKEWKINQAQLWDCYGYNWTALEYTYLRGLKCVCKIGDSHLQGEYLFTIAPIEDGFSNSPSQSKEFKFIKLNNGRITIQPTNKILFKDASFTDSETFIELKLQSEIYSSE